MHDKNGLLLYLAEQGRLQKQIRTSTGQIAKALGISQQTASRKLIELEKAGYLRREATPRGVTITMMAAGEEYLTKLYTDLKSVFNGMKKNLVGKASSGLGEGAYYMSQPGYRNQFERLLGISPYPGTLNLKVEYASFQQFIAAKEKVHIRGFLTKERTFGGLDAYKVAAAGFPAAIIIPERTSHFKETIEVISAVHFRKAIKLQDGDEVELE